MDTNFDGQTWRGETPWED